MAKSFLRQMDVARMRKNLDGLEYREEMEKKAENMLKFGPTLGRLHLKKDYQSKKQRVH